MAAAIVAQSVSDEPVPDPDEGKNPHAVALGRVGGWKGGKARAANLSHAERSAAARKAALDLWRIHRDPGPAPDSDQAAGRRSKT